MNKSSKLSPPGCSVTAWLYALAADGSVLPTPVPLLATVVNRIANTPNVTSALVNTNESETRNAPAVAYVGESSFDGKQALIVDYHGEEHFSTFRDEIRHIGCGVWLGKTYLTGPTDSLPASLEQLSGRKVNSLLTQIIEKSIPKVEPGRPLPHVLNFVLFQTR